MPERQRLTIALDSLEQRLINLLATTPVDALFWTVFDRKRRAIEIGTGRADVEFVRDRISAMLTSRHLAQDLPGSRH